jgi:hypothetical protein
VVNIKAGSDMTVRNSKTGTTLSVIRRNARLKESALRTYMGAIQMKSQPSRHRYTNEQLKARLIVFIGIALSFTFVFSVAGMLYALIFVTQPLGNQAPNDRAFIELLSTLTIFLTGALGSVLASNGLKDKPKSVDDTPKQDLPES